MPISTRVLFGTPQQEIASLIRDRLERCQSAFIVSGFVTVDGINSIVAPIKTSPGKMKALVVGSGTYRSFEALDGLIAAGVPNNRLFVHLGHTAPNTGRRNSFHKYHPMLHSKIYLMEMKDGITCAFLGSHNTTWFAMEGLNGEAAVMIEGPSDDPQFKTIRDHIDESRRQALCYDSSMKEALSWWTSQFLEGLLVKADDVPKDAQDNKTIVVLAAKSDKALPRIDEVIYFELPAGLNLIKSLSADVHIYIFPSKPVTPFEALRALKNACVSFSCEAVGLEVEEGGAELKVDWIIDNNIDPKLTLAPSPFRPTPTPGMQQVRVKISAPLRNRYEYLFDTGRESWEPDYGEEKTSGAPQDLRTVSASPEILHAENQRWFLVKGLNPVGERKISEFGKALIEASPESGNYILLSLRRRNEKQRKARQSAERERF